MNPPTPFPAARVAPQLSHAFGGIWRLTARRCLTLGHALAFGGLLAVLGLICFAFLTAGNGPDRYLQWAIGFYFTFLVPLMTFLSAAGTIRDELKSNSVDYVLTRPVPRPAFIAFKYLSHLICAQLEFLVALALVLGLGYYRGAPGLTAALPMLLLAQVLLVTAFSALGFFFGMLTLRYVVLGLAYAGLIEVGVGQIPTQVSRLSMTHQVHTMLMALVKIDPLVPAPGALVVTAYLLAFSVLAIALTAAVFSFREFAGSAEA